MTGASVAPLLGHAIESMMARKSAAEVALIRESARWCEHAHRLLQQYSRPGATEAEASLRAGHEATLAMLEALGADVRRPAGSRTAPPPATAARSAGAAPWAHAVAHNISSSPATCSSPRPPRRSGATTPSSSAAMVIGAPTDEMRRLFDHVVAAQQVAFDAIRPGVTCADVDHAVLDYFEAARSPAVLAAAHRPRDRPAQPRGAVPRRRRPHADRAGDGVHDRARRLPGGLGGFRHSDTVVVTEDGIEILTDYPRDLESLTIPA